MQSERPVRGLNLIPIAAIIWPAAIVGANSSPVVAVIPLVLGLLGLLVSNRRWRSHCIALAVCSGALALTLWASASSTNAFDSAITTDAVFETTVSIKEPPRAITGKVSGRESVIAAAEPRSHEATIGTAHVKVPNSSMYVLRFLSSNFPTPPALSAGATLRVRGTVSRENTTLFIEVARYDVIDPANATPHTQPLRDPLESALALIETGRRFVHERLAHATSFLPPSEAALVRGMTLGDTAGLSPEVKQAMKTTGLTHLVAVSGANVALVYAFVALPLLALGVPRKPRVVCAAVGIALYALAVGPEPSLLRAATMAVPLLVARFAGVRTPALRALALTVVGWSIGEPDMAGQMGFVLSVCATASILTLARPAADFLSELSRDRISPEKALIFSVPLVAQLACTPILILLSPEFSIWSVPANVCAEFLVAMCTLCGFMGVLLSLIHPLAAWPFLAVSGCGAHALILLAKCAASLPLSHVPLPGGSQGVAVVAFVLAVGVAAVWLRRERIVQWALCFLVAAACAVWGLHALAPARTDSWDVAMCDVGQGDAMLINSSPEEGGVIAVDAGPTPEAWATCAKDFGVRRVDLLILTHPHADHVGGASAVSGALAPNAVWACPLDTRSPAAFPGRVRIPKTGDSAQIGSVHVDVLWPADADTAKHLGALEHGSEESLLNDCSIATRFSKGSWSLVALGDLEPLAQEQLAKNGAVSNASIVKVAHHGSRRQSPALYAAIHPSIALIGVGHNNFGHPNAGTLTMLHNEGAQEFRTDTGGNIALTWENGSFRVRTER